MAKAFVELRQDTVEGTTLVGVSIYSPAAHLFATHEYNGKPSLNTGKCFSKDLRAASLDFKGECAIIEIDEADIKQNAGRNIDGIKKFTVVANGKEAIAMKREWQEAAIAAATTATPEAHPSAPVPEF